MSLDSIVLQLCLTREIIAAKLILMMEDNDKNYPPLARTLVCEKLLSAQ